jgi:hypothetical protein
MGVRDMRDKTAAVIVLIAAIALYAAIPAVSSQGATLVSRLVDKAPIDDPEADVWADAQPLVVPLSAQLIAVPRVYEASVKEVIVKSVYDGNRISFLLEWEAPIPSTGFLKHEEFRDAAAIQFSTTGRKTRFTMGHSEEPVNIWHWKADWQKDELEFEDIADKYPNMVVDYYPEEHQPDEDTFLTGKGAGNIFSDPAIRGSVIENLIAGGYGSLTTAEVQDVKGRGVYRDGKWRVVFSRDMKSEEGLAQFSPGEFQPVAFAVWYGANQERDGMKSVSSWYWVVPEKKTPLTVYLLPLLAVVAVVAGEYYYLRRSKKGGS